MKGTIPLLTSSLEGALSRGKRMCLFVVTIAIFLFISSATASAHITQLIPSSTAAGGPGFTLRLLGDFDDSDTKKVLFDGTRVEATLFTAVGPGGEGPPELHATIPASLITRPGIVKVALEGFNYVEFTIIDPANCTYTVSPQALSLDSRKYDFADLFIGVTAPATCTWTVTLEDRWIQPAERMGTGSGGVHLRIEENHSSFRSGSITVAGKQVVVHQGGGNCPVTLLCFFFPQVCFTAAPSTLDQTHNFRDNVLARTARGQRYTKLYYQFSTEAVQIMMLNPMLILRSRDILERYRTVLESMINGEQVTLTRGDIEEIESILNSFAEKGSAELRETLKGLREDLRDPQAQSEFNITLTEGSKRELPAPSTLQSIKQTGMMMTPLGLLLFCAYTRESRRKKAKPELKRLISGAITLSGGKKMKMIIALLASPLQRISAGGKQPFFFKVAIAILFFFSAGTASAHITRLTPNFIMGWRQAECPNCPHIARLIPSSIAAGSLDFTLRILGTNFNQSDTGKVLFNGTRVTAVLMSSQELQATIPASLIINPAIVQVTLEGFNSVGFSIDYAAGCSYSIVAEGYERFGSSGGVGGVSVTAGMGCDWTATSNASFITITSGSSGSGSGTVKYSVAARDSTGPPRVGTITIARQQPFTVRQYADCPASAYKISPESITLDGGDTFFHDITVTAPDDCLWTVEKSTAPWLHVSAGQYIGNSIPISYRADANDGFARVGVIYIAGKLFTVHQNGDCPINMCFYVPGGCGEGGTPAVSRRFRDEVLAESPRGQRYTKLYYQFSSEAVQIIMLNPMLIMRSREILERYKPVVQSMIKGEQVRLTRGDIEEIESFLSSFAEKGSAELRETLKGLREDLRDPQIHSEFNITVTEGPKRELSAQSTVESIKESGIMITPLGLLLFCIYTVRSRRRNAKIGLKRLISVAIVLSVIGGQWSVVSGQSRTTALRLASRKLEKDRAPKASEDHFKLPLAFEANQGQTDPQVKFISRTSRYKLFLTQTEAVFRLRCQNQEATEPITDVLRMKLIGANPSAPIEGLDKTPAVSNYFVGTDSAKWRASVPSYSRVRYSQIYPGVDMVYYGNRHDLEYDFKVAPGADPAQIRLGFEGADSIGIDASGDLVLGTQGGELRQRKPVAYQEVNGNRRAVTCHYRIHNPQSAIRSKEVDLDVGAYDRSKPLIIDPVLAYSTYFGGGGNEEGNSIAVDSAGNVYLTGFTDSINFPLANSSQPNLGGGQQDAFIVKLDPSGTRVVYSTYIGGNGQDNGTAIAVDGAGNAYITGFTDSTNFPVRNALQPTKRGSFNAFVVKVDPAGSMLNSTLFGGSIGDYGSSIAVDSSGNVYIAGIATSTDLPLASALQPQQGGIVDAYVAKIDPSGNRLVYSTYVGGIGIDGVSSIAVDSAGNVYLTGLTSSPDFRTVNAMQAGHGGGVFDAFVTKLNATGTQVIYSTYLGGGGEDRAFRIAVDTTGNAYVVGDTDSTNFPVANAAQRSNGGSADAFVAKLNASGSQLVYSTYLGGSGIDGGTAIAVDAAGSAYVTGFTASTNFPTVIPIQATLGGSYDGFVAKLSTTGSALDYSTYLGGSGVDSAFGVAADSAGRVYVMGVTASTNFPLANAFQQTNGGGAADLFIAKISSGPTVTSAIISGKKLLISGSSFDNGAKILKDGQVQKTANDDQNPTGALVGKKAGKNINQNQTVALQVRNSDGVLSNELRFTRP